MGKEEHQANQWQKIIRPPGNEAEKEEEESDRPGWIRKYLDLADLLIKRTQFRIEARRKNQANHRKAA